MQNVRNMKLCVVALFISCLGYFRIRVVGVKGLLVKHVVFLYFFCTVFSVLRKCYLFFCCVLDYFKLFPLKSVFEFFFNYFVTFPTSCPIFAMFTFFRASFVIFLWLNLIFFCLVSV